MDSLLVRPGWHLSVYPDAREAGGAFRSLGDGASLPQIERLPDPARVRGEAARRARAQVRRYCVSNRLSRLGTLTYAVGCHDPLQFRGDISAFWRRLRSRLEGRAFPYVWVPEWHKTSHGLHGHFAVGRFVPRGALVQAWEHGFVHIKLIGNLPHGSGSVEHARIAAGYLSKYASKGFGRQEIPGLHRYDVAQGFAPRVERVDAWLFEDALELACEYFGGEPPDYVWREARDDATGCPARAWARWR